MGAYENLRQELETWLDSQWDPDLSLVEWRALLLDAGWAKPSWPKRWWGRGLAAGADTVVAAALQSRAIPGPPVGASTRLAAPTLLEHGTDEQRERFLRPILTGEDTWCQLFSEPGNGSDLAGLTTRAVRDGEDYVVSGQKLWSTGAHHATYGMLIARSDWDAPKHHGITYFALAMDQPTIEVRPLMQMNGRASFNEIFLSDARVPAANLIGVENGGWSVARTTLANERRLADHRSLRPPDGTGRARAEARHELEDYLSVYDWYPQRGGRADLSVDHARRTGRDADPVVRQELARLHALTRSADWTAERLRAEDRQGPCGSLSKLHSSRIAFLAASVHSLCGGAHGMVAGPDSPFGGVIAQVQLSVPAVSIAGGTDEIQRNIVAEGLLGLPKEPSNDHQIPFREMRRN